MKVLEKIDEDLKGALKNKDEVTLSTLRLLKAVFKNKEIEQREELKEEQVLDIILKEIKKRKESFRIYKDAGREELADKEKRELEILQKYAPQEMPEEELDRVIKEEISVLEDPGLKDIGKVMSKVMPKVKGRVDGSVVSKKVAELLK